MEPQNKANWMMPASILLSAIIIGVALVYNAGSAGPTPQAQGNNDEDPLANVVDTFRSVSKEEHYFGNPNAKVVLIEYSDLECPFCKTVHPTFAKLVEEYKGEVAWVYRHFPLEQLHPKAPKEAEASECAAELGGNQAFWDYINKVFAVTPSNNGLDLERLPEIAEELGLNRAKFEACLASGKHMKKIEEDYKDAVIAGGQGTPFTLIVGKDGKATPISGARPMGTFKAAIDKMLSS